MPLDSFILPPAPDRLDKSATATLQQAELCVEHAGE